MRILLVEDSADHRELMRLVLTGHDPLWQVDTVVSGEETLRRLAEEKTYDLVFLDYSLPGRDGLDVLEEIRRGEAPPPVVMVTGCGDERVATEAIRGGAYDYVVKGNGYLERLPIVARLAVEAYQSAVERKQAEATIRSVKDRIQVLSRRLLEIQENDRRMLARELHDEIGQMLTVIKIDLQVIRRSPLQENLAARLDSSVATLDQCLRQVRNLSLSLRPPMLDDLGLVAALRWQLNHISQRVGFHAQLIADELPQRFHPDIDTACFRIVQEALTNITRHAKAHNVEVELRARRGEILLSVRDDGRGFDVKRAMADASHGTTFGILGMQERVTLLNGKLEITSARKLGTTMSARFPLRLARKAKNNRIM
jgi:signal transduction histidine kinase